MGTWLTTQGREEHKGARKRGWRGKEGHVGVRKIGWLIIDDFLACIEQVLSLSHVHGSRLGIHGTKDKQTVSPLFRFRACVCALHKANGNRDSVA